MMKTIFLFLFSFSICATFGKQKYSALVKRDTFQIHSDTTVKKRVTKIILAPPSKAWQRQSAIEDLQKYIGTGIDYCIFYYNGKVDKYTGITYLYFGGNYPDQYLTVKITKSDRMKFKYQPITEFSNKELCINGLLLNNHGSLEIRVYDPKQLKVVYTNSSLIK